MTERQVTIGINLTGASAAASQMAEIIKNRNELLSKQKINLRLDSSGLEQVKRASAQAQAASAAAVKDMGLLGSTITARAVPALQQYQTVLGSIAKASMSVGPGLVSALRGVSVEFARQKELAAFWGTSGYLHQGLGSFKSAMGSFVASGGAGFGSWLQNSISSLASYRTALVGASAVLVGFAAAAALSSKHAQNYISSTLDSRLMARKLPDKEGAAKWIESAQSTDWSKGAESRMGVFQTVLSKNKGMGQKQAQAATESIEKFFFANQEMMMRKGISSAEQFASRVSAPTLSGEDASIFEDIYGLGFSNLSSTARLSRVGTEAKDIDIDKEVAKRPDVVLSDNLAKGTRAVGDAALPALNAVLGMFLKVVDVVKKIPGLGAALGWGAVLLGAASAGLVMVSMVGSLIPGLMTVIGLISKAGIVTKLMAAAQWILNAAMTANPLGIVILAVAGLIVVLYALEKKFGLVSKAWKMFSESSIGKGVFAAIADGKKAIEDLLGTLGKAYKSGGVGGVLKVALEGIVANSPILKLVAFVVDFLRKLWANSNILNKLFAAGMAIWTKMTDFFTWLLDTIKSGLQWIRDGLGITKAEKEAKVKEIAEKEGVYQTKSGKWGKVLESAAGAGTKTPEENSQLFQPAGTSPRLKQAIVDALAAPKGVFESIPGIDLLTTAIGTLITTLENFKFPEYPAGTPGAAKVTVDVVAAGTGALGNNLLNPSQYNPLAVPNAIASTLYDYFTSEEQPAGQGQERPDKATWIADQIKQNPALSQENAEASYNHNYPPMARGGQIRRTGSLIGHSSEEMDPASVVAGGKTTLARINELFADRGSAAVGGQPITVNSSITVNVAKMDSKADVKALAAQLGEEFDDKLLFRIRNKLDATSSRGIAYLRG